MQPQEKKKEEEEEKDMTVALFLNLGDATAARQCSSQMMTLCYSLFLLFPIGSGNLLSLI